MFRGRVEKLFLIFLLSAALSDVSLAAATVSVEFCAESPIILPPVNSVLTSDTSGAFCRLDSQAAQMGLELLDIPTKESTAVSVNSMPAVPAALLLVLTGFICITLVHDRKSWLALFAGVIGLAVSGISTFPRFAEKFVGAKKLVKSSAAAMYSKTTLSNAGLRVFRDLEQRVYINTILKLSGLGNDDSLGVFNKLQYQQGLTHKVSKLAANISFLTGCNKLMPHLARSTRFTVVLASVYSICNPAHGPPV